MFSETIYNGYFPEKTEEFYDFIDARNTVAQTR
jgi:hypothetical protein